MVVFFVFALGFTLLLQAPAALATIGLIPGPAAPYMPLMMLGTFGPILAATVCAFREGSARALYRRFLIGRVSPVWYAVALFGAFAVYVASRAVYGLLGGHDAGWIYLPEKPEHFAGLVMIPLVEEVGWRGYALPRLIERHGAARASVLLGVAWAIWHTMMFLFQSPSPAIFAISMANILVGSFWFTWIFQRTKGSLLLAYLAHMGSHLFNAGHDERVAPMVILTVGLAVVVVASFVLDPKAWTSRQPT